MVDSATCNTGGGRTQRSARGSGGDGYIRQRSFVIRLRSGQRRLSLVESRLRIPRIDFYQHLPFLHLLVVLHVHLGDVSLDPSADLHQISIDLGVIRALVISGMPPVQTNANQ